MEIYGNPISGYTTEYYSALLEEGKRINKEFLANKLSCGNGNDEYCCGEQKLNYNRTRKK